jgi:hypothetical protein
MAKAQGGNAITVWMIVFVALWLASTVFLVILYTGQQELLDENARLRLAKDKLISDREESSLALTRAARSFREGGPTVVGLLEEARSVTAEIATGSGDDDVAAVRSKRDQLLKSLEIEKIVDNAEAYVSLSYHQAMARLYEAHRGLHERWRVAQDNLIEVQSELEALRQASETLKADFAKRSQALQEELASIEASRTQYRRERDEAVAAIEREFDDARALQTQVLTNERQQRQECERRLSEAQERFTAIRERLGGLAVGPEELATARQPDGRILTAVPGDEVVYINLGRQHGLTLGLQFAVYSADTGIPPDGRGKGQIEVVSISESSAECRILRVARNQVILEGDLIANPVFNPHRALSFVVIGQFDLDRDGVPDRDGAQAVQALIGNWGGQVTDELNPLTDFLVVGIAPQAPRAEADLPTELQERNRALQRAWDAYQNTLATAQALAIPILTQDVFMNFLGLGSDMVSRR